MVMDGLNLAASVMELKRIEGGRIDKLQQPEKDELVIGIRNGGENYRLLLCASPENCRMQLTNTKRENPIEAPSFCMLLRKKLMSGRVLSVAQPKLDRTVYISIEAKNELGDIVPYTLSIEVMGKYSNIILVNEKGVILDAIRRVGVGMSNVRVILPGMQYAPPPSQDKKDPLEASAEDIIAVLNGPIRIDKALSGAFFGLAPAVAARLAANTTDKRMCDELTDAERISTANYICDFYAKLKAGTVTPVIVLNENGEPAAVYPFVPKGADVRVASSIGEALDAYYAETDLFERMHRHGANIRRLLNNNIERCQKKLALYNDAMASGGDIERLRLYGELLTANLHSIVQGAREAAVLNYYLDPPERLLIPIDARYSPNDNAQRYYKKYQKAKAASNMAATQREEVLKELDYLEGQLDNLDKCTAANELRELSDELTAEGYLKRPKNKAKAQKLPVSKPMCFESSDGIEIYVGKNNRQNDEITLKLASPRDIWLHTKNIPGSHVIVRSAEPPKSTLYEAALLAAYFSKGRGGAQIAVDYTEKRFVKKPAGAKPGMVIYTTNKTAFVTPEASEVKKIKQKQ